MTLTYLSIIGLSIAVMLMAWELYKIRTTMYENFKYFDRFYESVDKSFDTLADFRDVSADNFETIQQVNDNVRDEIVKLNLKISMLQKKLGGR